MAITGLSQTIERATEIRDRFLGATAALELALERGLPSRLELEDIRATLQGTIDDARFLLRDLDAVDELDFLPIGDGRRTIELWRWRRSSRREMLRFLGLARNAQVIAAELAGGQRDQVVIAREGDTWQSIAARHLGDWREWPRLLEANPTLEPGVLPAGTSMIVPELR